ncbi:hypothetical protein DYB30_005634 [Aphanomyces astaci]|uniref:Core-binding (CB) domain-containing protein n=1 Tax=Aphanomyces astaci TaxID=112090 RepID=A0A397DEK3_APHAT|nr:hypothetical protein DYB30_005634 [Aphanomyces astaci]RHY64689.1 hypothetical protein DYB34_008146 [Aphanomyces astaci]RHY68154.1 hypothetical protein DYB38_009192 [Aphanomyces astaci]RHZ31811.1 hypothetical protein DYB26_007756 [Aphanomyces astaci]RHZ38892.1 hypothetical protein DYB31_005630 [Aphanomyces astaci]
MAPMTILQRQETSLEDIIDSCLADSTKERYESGLRQLIKWIHLTGGTDLLKDDGMIDLRVFQYTHFVQFIVWVYQNTPVKVGTMSGYRAALRWYYKREDVAMPVEYSTKLKTIFTGLPMCVILYGTHTTSNLGMHRLTATDEQTSTLKDSGKRPLGFSMYEALCQESLKTSDSGFVHLYLVISWNLMARSKSTETIRIDHISFEEDAIGITYIKSKTDQTGSKRRDPRHVYANPSSPAICTFLALGMYFACNPTLANGSLFPGASQRDRFGKALKALVYTVLGEAASGTVGTHSIRKGAATFVCSGSTSGPSVITVCLRCGWSLGNVVERYMHYEKAGDQFVGRVVAGLPLNNADFAQLPPHFDSTDNSVVTSALRCMFPVLFKTGSLIGVLKLGLASIVHHADFLRTALPANHPVLHTAIFRDNAKMSSLKAFVRTTSATLKPTGLPPYVEIYRQLQTQQLTLATITSEVVAGGRNLLDEKELATGTVTPAYIDKLFSSILKRLARGTSAPEVTVVHHQHPRHQHMLYSWGGRLHKLPESFAFPNVDTATAWALWWLGKDSEIPFRTIDPHDLATKKQRRILSE